MSFLTNFFEKKQQTSIQIWCPFSMFMKHNEACFTKWRPPSLSELTPIMLNMELTYFASKGPPKKHSF